MRFKIIFLLFLPIFLHSSDIHVKLLEPLLGISYRVDGTTNSHESYTLFADQNKIFKTAGLNCSGFVLTASKRLLGINISINEAKFDLNNNSNSTSHLGEDWDFGRDFILNIAQKYKYSFISNLPINKNSHTNDGIKISDPKEWKKIFPRIKKEHFYLVAFSKKINKAKYKVLYHHVGVIVKDDLERIWLYHATAKNDVHRLWLNKNESMSDFFDEYLKDPNGDKKALIVEIMV